MDELSAFLHTPAWERFQRSAGFVVERQHDYLYIQHQLGAGGSYWSSARTAIDSNWQLPEFAKKSWFLRVEPVDPTSYENLIHYAKSSEKKLVVTLANQPKQTTYLDLTQSEESLLAAMKSKHRYNIRLAEKHEVQTELHTENLISQYPRFLALLQETSARHEFRTHSPEYYRKMLSELEKDDAVRLAFATKDGVDLATLLIVTCNGVATYLHGASTQLHKELMAPHLLHWRTIQALKNEAFHAYDFWGTNAVQNAEGEWEAIPNHASNGTTRFKLGFGGQIKNYHGCYDLVLNSFCYTLYKGIRGLRSRKRAFS